MQKTLSIIDLSAIRSNAKFVRSLIGNRTFYAVVKADAYGHGGVEVSLALQDLVDGFCVAIVDEGVALRVGGVSKPIIVLTPPLGNDDIQKLSFYNLTPTVGSVDAAKLVSDMHCHIAINTGMNRYGCYGKELEKVLDILPPNGADGVFTHMYAAASARHCGEQYSSFMPAVEKVKAHSPNAITHMSASGGILRGGKYLLDGVRCGLMLYGYAPTGFKAKELKPALKVYSRLAQAITPTGSGVGYNIAEEDYSKLYTYRAGYADGFNRTIPLGEKTLCMDAFISKKRKLLMPVMTDADAYAKRCGTISYEILCSVTQRSERIYIK